MAKYIAYRSGEETPFVHIADEDCKSWWLKIEPRLLFLSITDSDYEKAKWTPMKIENDAWAWNEVGDENGNPVIKTITEDDFNTSMDKFKNRAKVFLNNNENLPSHYDNGVAAIDAFNSSGITFPVTAKNWIKACVDNNKTVPFILEFH